MLAPVVFALTAPVSIFVERPVKKNSFCLSLLTCLSFFVSSAMASGTPDQTPPTQTARADRSSLFAVVFEVKPNAQRGSDYLRIAKGLRPVLVAMPGFLENERFRSRTRPGYLLSLSLWADEKALVRWRTVEKHH